MGFIKWLKREPEIITVIDPQSALKTQVSDSSYIRLDALLRDLNQTDQAFAVWGWINGVEPEEIDTWLTKCKGLKTEEKPKYTRTYEDRETIRNMTEFLETQVTVENRAVKPLTNTSIKEYRFPPLAVEDMSLDEPVTRQFPYDRTAALSKGGVYTPRKLRDREKEILKRFDELVMLGLKPKLPADIKKKQADIEHGLRPFIFGPNREVIFLDKKSKKTK